jgi:gamma-glutamylcyclotransferase (GGCT)/AIG2-like uncharacterized protein YtfP
MSDDGRPSSQPIRSGDFNLFVYGTLRRGCRAHEKIADCDFVGVAHLNGTLYDIDGLHPALMLYGNTSVAGEIFRCPADRLAGLDLYEGVDSGLFRRVAAEIDGTPCWVYVAGPALAHRLTPGQRIDSGKWTGAGSDG